MTRLDLTRSVPAPRERVWRAWTDADELATWFWPPSFAAEASMDLRLGGVWHIRSATAGIGVGGEVAAVEAPERLVLTWRWDGDDDETRVTVTFADERDATTGAERTLLRIVHERFRDAQAATDHEQGWNDCLNRLPAALG